MRKGKYSVSYPLLEKNGRLCNMMFQAAATVAYAIENDMDYLFPEFSYNKYLKNPLPIGFSSGAAFVHREPKFSYSPIPKVKTNVDLYGFYQSPLYFIRHRDIILELFEPNDTISARVRQESLLLAQRGKRMCSIHVRRGDYVTNPGTNAYHGVLSMDYYLAAINELYLNGTNDILFVIFSDDIEWCKEAFNSLQNKVFMQGNSDFVDLQLMACCSDHIIANSSYSWWGSYLSKYKDKRIVAPRQWFTGSDAPKDTQDIYLPYTTII